VLCFVVLFYIYLKRVATLQIQAIQSVGVEWLLGDEPHQVFTRSGSCEFVKRHRSRDGGGETAGQSGDQTDLVTASGIRAKLFE